MSKKFSQLTLIDAVTGTDILAILDDPGGTPVLKKATVTQLTALCEKAANKGQANGYAGLNGNGDVLLSTIFPASAGSLVLGRRASGAGDWEEITLGTGLSRVGTVLTGTAPAGGGAWTFITSQAVGTASNYDFTGLGTYNEILVVCTAITVSTTCVIQMLVSVDNGLNFLNSSGDYLSIDGSTFAAANDTTLSSSNNGSATRYTSRMISNFNTTHKKISSLFSAVGANAGYVIPTLSALNAIRVRTHTGNFTGGTIDVYGRS